MRKYAVSWLLGICAVLPVAVLSVVIVCVPDHPRVLAAIYFLLILQLTLLIPAAFMVGEYIRHLRAAEVFIRRVPNQRQGVLVELAGSLNSAYDANIQLQKGQLDLDPDGKLESDPMLVADHDYLARRYGRLRKERQAVVQYMIDLTRQEFWDVHNLLEDMGYTVHGSYKDYLPKKVG